MTSREIIEILLKINREQKTTILVVTHDITIVEEYKQRTITIANGCVASDTLSGGYEYDI